jgi:RNA polymerase sigma factor (sigma-70 family)
MAIGDMNRVIHQLRKLALAQDGVESTDGQLLECFVSRRENAALEALMLRHGPMVWGVCRRLLNHHDAEDAFQATFLILVRKAAAIMPREMVGNWLYGVAHQAALNARTRIAKTHAREVQLVEMPEPTPIDEDCWRDLGPILDRELTRLPDKYRAAVVLCDLEGKARKEAARQLGLPEGTVASRLARGRAMLAKRLARHGLPVSAAMLAAILAHKASAAAPALVMTSALKTVTAAAAGHATAGVISLKVANLTEGVLKIMFLTKFKTVMAAAFAVIVMASVAGLLVHQTAPAAPAAADGQAEAKNKEAADAPARRDAPKGDSSNAAAKTDPKAAPVAKLPADEPQKPAKVMDLEQKVELAEKHVDIKKAALMIAAAQERFAEAKLKIARQAGQPALLSMEQAKKDLERKKTLRANGVVDQAVIEQAEVRWAAATQAMQQTEGDVLLAERQIEIEHARRVMAEAEVAEVHLRLRHLQENLAFARKGEK